MRWHTPRNRALYEGFYIDLLTNYKPYTDVLVLDELIYVSKKRYGIPYSISMDFVESNVLPYISIVSLGEEEYRYAADLLGKYDLKPSDALHLGAMLHDGITLIASEDRGFDRVREVRRLWIHEL